MCPLFVVIFRYFCPILQGPKTNQEMVVSLHINYIQLIVYKYGASLFLVANTQFLIRHSLCHSIIRGVSYNLVIMLIMFNELAIIYCDITGFLVENV